MISDKIELQLNPQNAKLIRAREQNVIKILLRKTFKEERNNGEIGQT